MAKIKHFQKLNKNTNLEHYTRQTAHCRLCTNKIYAKNPMFAGDGLCNRCKAYELESDKHE